MLYIMFFLFGCSVAMRIFLGILYSNLIRGTENMAITDNVPLKQCKTKFIKCFQLNGGVSNVPVFVEKFMSRLTIGPFSYESIYHFSGQLMLLSVVAAGVGICKGFASGDSIGKILPYYIACFAGLYLYFSVTAAVNLAEKKKILKVNLVDYLENHLAMRIGTTQEDMEMLGYVEPGEKYACQKQEQDRNAEQDEADKPDPAVWEASEKEDRNENTENTETTADMQEQWDALLEEIMTI